MTNASRDHLKSNGPLSTYVVVAALAAASCAVAEELGCKGNPRLTGQCFTVQGTVSLSGDSGFVLGRDDTGRSLVIGSAPNSKGDWPTNLTRTMERAQKQTGFASAWVHGDYEVCPIPSEVLERQYVCIQSAIRLRPERAGERK